MSLAVCDQSGTQFYILLMNPSLSRKCAGQVEATFRKHFGGYNSAQTRLHKAMLRRRLAGRYFPDSILAQTDLRNRMRISGPKTTRIRGSGFRAMAWILLVAFALQSYITETHIHGTFDNAAARAAAITNVAIQKKAPAD